MTGMAAKRWISYDSRMADHESSANHTTNSQSDVKSSAIGRNCWFMIIAAMALRWTAQPPVGLWPCVFVAIVPLLILAKSPANSGTGRLTRRHYLAILLAATVYWALSLQGLRHANPLIYPCWLALAGYLASFSVMFVWVLQRINRGNDLLVVPIVWVGLECVRNYFLTGISVLMLGHSLADVPQLIQIADLGGTYAVSFLIVVVNVAVFQWTTWFCGKPRPSLVTPLVSTAIASVLLVAAVGYGRWRLAYPLATGPATIALIGRNEPIEYVQTKERELEIFQAYLEESVAAIKKNEEKIDAVVWPESMMTGTLPWIIGDGNPDDAKRNGVTMDEVTDWLNEQRQRFLFRASNVLQVLADGNGPANQPPHFIGGCAVVEYSDTTKAYSSLVHVTPNAEVADWYGKMHLVMFGEYIPFIKSIPWVKDFVPPGLGIDTGDGPRVFDVNGVGLSANICIETAVERVSVNHFRVLRNQNRPLPDAIVTATNDGWFDDSSVIEHHKRCAQLLAVVCRRPVLSAANNGPTVWIDSYGRVVDQLTQGTNGHLVAKPQIDDRLSLAVRIGDWPARLCVLLSLALLWASRQHREPTTSPTDTATKAM
ncbi:apolipoprotein N-acyltransferase [Rhodopirellula baltica]|nr:apolipoprotein N-acyltransferase [Rhodopirellula baltica]